MDRADIVHQNFLTRVKAEDFPTLKNTKQPNHANQTNINQEQMVDIFKAQVLSRHLDRISRKMQARGEGFYTIGSSGHEGNAAIAAAVRPTDMAFLHYRDAAFQIARAMQVPDQNPMRDILLSFAVSTDDPISGGRHKVLGSKALFIPPQTSTIASHLPKAVGAAFSVSAAKRIKPEHKQIPDDSIIVCSFGDASLNHSTAQGAINTACWTSYQNTDLPLLFVCQDNGIGISTKTPNGWVEANMSNRAGLEYFACNGLDINETFNVTKQASDWVRKKRKPAFLHVSCVRLFGHAGPDLQNTYLTKEEIERDEANDPLLHTAGLLVANGVATNAIIAIYQDTETAVVKTAEEVVTRPRLASAEEVMASIIPPKRNCAPTNGPSPEDRAAMLGEGDLRALSSPQPMAKLINIALSDLMLEHKEIVIAGEDVGKKGGVYGVTQRLQQRFGINRVIDTLLDEQSILGLSIGMAHNGFIPIPEIQFLAYLHNAEDQLRGEAATLSFFSNGQFTNPMVVRIAGLGYQRGFGGHFHNDNSFAVLRDIPGIIIACPSNGHDAALMLKEAVRFAREEQRIVVFVEPIALYMTKDLHEEGDGLWMKHYPRQDQKIEIDGVGVSGEGKDVAIVSYANGFYLSVKASKILKEKHNIDCRVIDLRWLAPLPVQAILKACDPCKRVLIVDECRDTGSQSEGLMAMFAENSEYRPQRLTAKDSFIATGPAYGATLPSVDEIVERVLGMVK